MNNLTHAQELAQAFKDAGIEPPESEKLITIDWNTTHAYTCAAYSTDELLRILPYAIPINVKRFAIGQKVYHKTIYGDNYGYFHMPEKDWLFDLINKDPKTALTELLKWALKNHPDVVRKHLEER